MTVSLSLLPVKAANTSGMHKSDQITVELRYLQNHRSLMLHWHSFSEWVCDRVALSFANTCCQYIGYAYEWPNHYVITVLTKPQIIDSRLILILGMGRWLCHCLFCLVKLPMHWLCIRATKSLCNYRTEKTTNRWYSVDAISPNGVVTVLLSLLPMKAANTSVMHKSDQITV